MAVDPNTLSGDKLFKQLNHRWTSSIIHNIKSSEQLQSQCIDKCDMTANQCPIVLRLTLIMEFYSTWININKSSSNSNLTSVSGLISNLEYYSITQLTNDWHHLRKQHWINTKIQHTTRQHFESVTVSENVAI